MTWVGRRILDMDRMKITIEQERVDDGALFIQVYINGYYTNVSCTDAALILRNGYHRFNRSLQAEFEYHLDWQQVRGIAEEILTFLQKLHARNPRAYVTTGYTGENLIDRIPDYRKSLLLIP